MNRQAQEQAVCNFHPLDAFKDEPKGMSDAERVAYAFAKERHAHEKPRKKLLPIHDAQGECTGQWQEIDYPYDVHLHLVHRLLKEAGVTDPALLCAAFMHDMIEDCKDAQGQKYTQESLKEEFATRLVDNGAVFENDSIDKTLALVKEVTNPPKVDMHLGKRLHQTSKQLSSEAKLLKIADQCASLIEDVMIKSQKEDSLLEFTSKARDVVVACQENNPANNFLRAVENDYFGHAMALLRLKKNFPALDGASLQREELKIRDSIDLGEVCAKAHAKSRENNQWLYQFPIYPEDEQLRAVELDEHEKPLYTVSAKLENGQVAGLRFLFYDHSSTLLRQAGALIKHIEAQGDPAIDAVTRVKSRVLIDRVCFDEGAVAKAIGFVNASRRPVWGDETADRVIQCMRDFQGKKETSLELGFHMPMSLVQCQQMLEAFPEFPTTHMQGLLDAAIHGDARIKTVDIEGVVRADNGKPSADLVPLDAAPTRGLRGVYAGPLKQYRTLDGRFAPHPDNVSPVTR